MVSQPRRGPAAALVIGSLALIMLMTLRPEPSPQTTPRLCIFCGSLGGVDFVLNVLLFVPLGIGLQWFSRRWRTVAIIGAVTTLAIESLQWRTIPGRDAALGDLVANTLGAVLGAWIAVEVLRWVNASSHAARKYAAVFGLVAAATVSTSALLLQPIPLKYPQWVLWTPERVNMDLFRGRLLEVEVNQTQIHPTQILPAAMVLDSLSRGLTVRAVIGGPVPATRRQAIIVRVANSLEEGFFLSQWGEAAAFRTHLAAARLRLRPILVGLEGVFSTRTTGSEGASGEFTIEGNSNPRAIIVRRLQPGVETIVTVRRTVGLSWALFMPWDVALGPKWLVVNAFWLAAMVLPVSFFTVRSGGATTGDSARRIAWWPLPLVLATLVAVPVTGMSALSIAEWFGVLAGIAAGLLLERVTATPARADLKGNYPDGTILP